MASPELKALCVLVIMVCMVGFLYHVNAKPVSQKSETDEDDILPLEQNGVKGDSDVVNGVKETVLHNGDDIDNAQNKVPKDSDALKFQEANKALGQPDRDKPRELADEHDANDVRESLESQKKMESIQVKQESIDEKPNVIDSSELKPNFRPAVGLKLDDLKPPDHLDAVRMEQDGHLNRDYKKEIFLGNHEEMEDEDEEEIKQMLETIFHK